VVSSDLARPVAPAVVFCCNPLVESGSWAGSGRRHPDCYHRQAEVHVNPILRLSLLSVIAAASLGAAGCAVSAPSFEDDEEIFDPDRADGFGPPAVVLIEVDDATIEWSRDRPSRFDGLPIGEPGPDRRFRETHALIQEVLNHSEPRVANWIYHFPPHSSSASEALMSAFERASFPLVFGPGPDRFEQAPAGGLIGHDFAIEDLKRASVWGIPLDDVEALAIWPETPFSVVAIAAYLHATHGIPLAETWRVAERRARCQSESFVVQTLLGFPSRRVDAVPIREGGKQTVRRFSAAALLEAPSEVARAQLAGAIVFVGDTVSDPGIPLVSGVTPSHAAAAVAAQLLSACTLR
jgi:hypothetical protein